MTGFYILLVEVIGLLLLYLSSPNQRWLSRSLAGGLSLGLAMLLLIGSAFLWIWHMSTAAGLFTALSVAMALLPAFPLLSLLRRAGRAS